MIHQDIIKRYLNGEATDEEIELLKAYLGTDDLSLLKDWMARDWRTEAQWNEPLPLGLSDEMLENIKQRVRPGKVVRLKKRSNAPAWVAAASVTLLLCVAAALWLFRTDPVIHYATGNLEWQALELPDGSWVKLNANSEISYNRRWSAGSDRRVWLKGEAFFKVEKKPATHAKFIVVTDDLEVEVLGTSFNVSSRGAQTDVFLEEGQIRLNMGDREETLQPGDFVAYSAQKKAILERRNETHPAEPDTSWKKGVLIIKDKSIAEILTKIEELYGIETEVLDTGLLEKIMTVSVPMGELELTIPLLEGTFRRKISRQENLLIIN